MLLLWVVRFKPPAFANYLIRLLIAAGATSFVLATKEAKRPSQHNPCQRTRPTPGRVRWQADASLEVESILNFSHINTLHKITFANYANPRKISNLLLGASGDKKLGIVLGLRLGRLKKSTGHSVSLCCLICTY